MSAASHRGARLAPSFLRVPARIAHREHTLSPCARAFVLPPRGAGGWVPREARVACGGSGLCLHVLSGPVSLRGLVLTVLVGVSAASLGECLSPCPACSLHFEERSVCREGSPGSAHDAYLSFSHGLLRWKSPCCGSCPAPPIRCPGPGLAAALLCARTGVGSCCFWSGCPVWCMPLSALPPGVSLLKGSRAGRQGVRVDMGT